MCECFPLHGWFSSLEPIVLGTNLISPAPNLLFLVFQDCYWATTTTSYRQHGQVCNVSSDHSSGHFCFICWRKICLKCILVENQHSELLPVWFPCELKYAHIDRLNVMVHNVKVAVATVNLLITQTDDSEDMDVDNMTDVQLNPGQQSKGRRKSRSAPKTNR